MELFGLVYEVWNGCGDGDDDHTFGADVLPLEYMMVNMSSLGSFGSTTRTAFPCP